MIRVHPALVLLVLGSFFCSSKAIAQTSPNSDEPIISRMCLWNADRTMWKQLGMKRKLVRLLNEIKLKYPAVVGGQWDVESESNDAGAPHEGIERRTTGVPDDTHRTKPAPASGQHAEALPVPAITRLQAELRAVLTPRQLHAWAERCGERYSKLPELRRMPDAVQP